MTHRTVPLDLLVRVRDALEHYRSDLFERGHESDASALLPDIAELTAQIEQQREGGENIADEHSDTYARMPEWWENLTQEQKAKLAALGAQREGQGEPVAWQFRDAHGEWQECSRETYEGLILVKAREPTRALYTAPPATPQDSVPAWAWRDAILDFGSFGYREIPKKDDSAKLNWIESRALALAQTKG